VRMRTQFDTIAAISTPPGKGGVALIRISGDGANGVAERVFQRASGKPYETIPPRVQCYGYIVDGDERIDDVLLTRFPAPNSYTGEDLVEISCHGGILVTRTVLEAVLRCGARAAEAGEFTRRAFIGGKLSLTEAEAIGSLLEAESREQLRLSSEPARRRLGERIEEIRRSLVELMSSMYARIDYPDEDLGDFTDGELLTALTETLGKAERLLSTYRTGRAVTEGIVTVLCGKPNVGKSSLYNLLVGEDAAIVTDVAGTTRDVLERSVPLGKVVLRLYDTAGIRDVGCADEIERIGIEKSRVMLEKCELLFAIFDSSRPYDAQDETLIKEIDRLSCAKIALLNKSDRPSAFDEAILSRHFTQIIRISARDEADTVEQLSALVDRLFTDGSINIGTDAVISSARQHAELSLAAEYIGAAIESLRAGFPQDAVSGDVERAIGAISRLDGRAVGEDIVADIFSKFCVGK